MVTKTTFPIFFSTDQRLMSHTFWFFMDGERFPDDKVRETLGSEIDGVEKTIFLHCENYDCSPWSRPYYSFSDMSLEDFSIVLEKVMNKFGLVKEHYMLGELLDGDIVWEKDEGNGDNIKG